MQTTEGHMKDLEDKVATTEREIYACLAQIAKMDGIVLVLSTPVPTPELMLEFLQSVIAAEHERRSTGADEEGGMTVHILQATESLRSVQ